MFDDKSKCPCGNGRLVMDCWCKTHQMVPQEADTRPPGFFTGVKINGCYAKQLKNCGGRLSGEHIVPECMIMETIRGKTVRVVGARLRAEGPEGRVIPVKTLVKRALCERHNCALSGLDVVGATFARAHINSMIHIRNKQQEPLHHLFNGFDVERMMLKILCALQHNERIPGSTNLKLWTVPSNWLEILFSGAPFKPGTGLYVSKLPNPKPPSPGISNVRIYSETWPKSNGIPIIGHVVKALVGIQLSIFGIDWQLLMTPPANSSDFVYRPKMNRFLNQDSVPTAYLHLGWKESPCTFLGNSINRKNFGFSDAMAEEVFQIRQDQAKRL